MEKTKVLLVDKQEIFLEGLANTLQEKPNISVVGRFSKGLEAIEKACELEPDVAILGTEISDCEFTSVVLHICSLLPKTRILILTDSKEEDKLISSLDAGATGYLSKDISLEDLVKGIFLVAAGGIVISPPMSAILLKEVACLENMKRTKDCNNNLGLTHRQREVLSLVTKGKSNKEIADTLFITDNTVKVHLHRVMQKLHVRNRTEAVTLAREKGIVLEANKRDVLLM